MLKRTIHIDSNDGLLYEVQHDPQLLARFRACTSSEELVEIANEFEDYTEEQYDELEKAWADRLTRKARRFSAAVLLDFVSSSACAYDRTGRMAILDEIEADDISAWWWSDASKQLTDKDVRCVREFLWKLGSTENTDVLYRCFKARSHVRRSLYVLDTWGLSAFRTTMLLSQNELRRWGQCKRTRRGWVYRLELD